MGAIASQTTSLTIIYSIVHSDADQRKHQSSASLAFVRGIHRGPVNSPHKWPVTWKMFPFDDVIMLCHISLHGCNFTEWLWLMNIRLAKLVYWYCLIQQHRSTCTCTWKIPLSRYIPSRVLNSFVDDSPNCTSGKICECKFQLSVTNVKFHMVPWCFVSTGSGLVASLALSH